MRIKRLTCKLFEKKILLYKIYSEGILYARTSKNNQYKFNW